MPHIDHDTIRLLAKIAALEQLLEEYERSVCEQAEKLQAKEEMLRLIIDTIPQHVFWKDRNSNYLGCNKHFAQAAGIEDPGSIIGRNDLELPWKETAELYRTDDRAVMETGTSKLNFEEPVSGPDGSSQFARTSKVPLRDQTGTVFGVLGVFEDITEQKRMGRLLEFQNAMLAAQQATSPDGILVVNEAGEILSANQRFSKMWNIPDELMKTRSGDKAIQYVLKMLVQPEAFTSFIHDLRTHAKKTTQGEIPLRDGRTFDHFSSLMTSSTGEPYGRVWYFRDITERKRAEEKLSISEEKYRNLFETSQDGLVFVSLDGRIQDANQAYLDMLGYSLEEIRDMTYQQLTPARWAPMEAAIVKDQILERGYSDEYEKEYIRKDGTVFPISVRGWTIRDKDGRPTRILGIIRDITERKRADEELHKMQDQLQTALQAGQAGLWTWDLKTNGVYLSSAWKAQIGYTDKELPDRFEEFESRIHPEDRDRTLQGIATFIEHPAGNYENEFRLRHKDGSYRWMFTRANVKKDVAGRPAICMGCNIDITERKRAEDELKFKSVLLSTQQETTLDGILVVNEKGQMISHNKRFVEMWGLPDEILASRSDERARQYVSGKLAHPEQFNAGVRHLLQHPAETVHDEIELRDGRTFERYSAAMVGAGGTNYGRVFYFRDITERKRMAEALRISEDLFKNAFTSAPIGMALIGLDGGWLRVNRILCDIVGYSEAEMLATSFQAITHPDDLQNDVADFNRMLNSEIRAYQIEKRYFHKDRHIVWILKSVSAVRDLNGKLLHFIAQIQDITERKRIEDALRTSEARLGLIAHSTNDLLWDWNTQTDELWWNDSLQIALGYRADEIEPGIASWTNRIHPDDRARIEPSIHDAIDSGKNDWSGEYRFRLADGSYNYFLDRGYAIRDAQGKPVRMLGSMVNITERKSMETKLLRSQEQLHLAIESGNAGLWSWDIKTNDVYLSPTWKEQLGYADGEMPNRFEECEDRLHPEDRDRVLRDMRSLVQNPSSHFQTEYRMRHKDHTYRWFLSRAEIRENAEGQLTLLTGCNIDITDRKQGEERMQLLTHALEASANGVAITDFQGTIQWVNPAFTVLTGYSREEAVGQNPRVLKSGRHDQNFYAHLWSTIKNGSVWHGEIINRRKNGSFYEEEMTISPVINPQGTVTHFVAVKQDITERKKMEAKTDELERLSTMSQLTDGIAHEMKNPLFILTGRLQLLKEKLDHREYGALPDDLQKIESAAERMTHIAERFSRLAQHSDFSPEPTAAQAVLKRVLESLADDLAKNRIAVTTALAPDLPTIQVDPQKLQTAFTNLIRNATQAMTAAHGKGNLTVTAARQDGWIEIRIQDDGPGIAPEHRARLFEPFFTTKPAGQGVGMGLWAVRATAMALRGTVACETELGKGATFIMRLPVVAPSNPHG
jgi:PAS domain S-box-containing protein